MALQLVVLVLKDTSQLDSLMEAWTTAGARGLTVLNSISAVRLQGTLHRDDLPLFPSLKDLLESEDQQHPTLFAIADDALVDQLIAIAQALVGDFDAATTGMLFTVPVGRVLGLGQP